MRIVQVIHGFLPQFRGGTELYLLGLCREMRKLGHEVHIITGTTDNAPESHVEDFYFDGFPVKKIVLSGSYLEHWTRSFSPEAARLFAETVAEIKPDLVHIQHWYRLSRSLIETCHRMNIPAVCTLHDLWTTCPRIFRIRDESFCTSPLSGAGCASCVPKFPWMEESETGEAVELFKADFANEMALAHRIIVPSMAHADVIANVVDLPRDKVQVIPHGTIIDLQEDRPTSPPKRRTIGKRAKLFSAKKIIRIGMWAHLFHMKGAHLVLEALQTLRDKGLFEFHVWGEVTEPQYKKRLEAAAEGVQVKWHGAFIPEDLRQVDLDIAVIPSLCSESFSFVLDEAFDLNLPAIVPKRGALAERIGAAGTTFLPEDANDLARVFKILLKKPELIDDWRRAIPEITSMTWHAREIQFIYQDVVNRIDQVELKPSPGLAWRRLEFQTAWNRRQEAMMFGYLGHIKRESGRGDHFEGEMRRLMAEKEEWSASLNQKNDAMIDAQNQLSAGHKHEETQGKLIQYLAQEIEALRSALVSVNHPLPQIRKNAPTVEEFEDHIPGLGTVNDVVTNNQVILDDYNLALRGLAKASLDKVLLLLSEEILAFRHLLTLGTDEASEFVRTTPRIPTSEVDLPGVGTVTDLVHENDRVMEAYSDLSRRQLEQLHGQQAAMAKVVNEHAKEMSQANRDHEQYCATLLKSLADKAEAIEILAQEIGLFRESLVLIKSDETHHAPALPNVDPESKEDIPGFGELAQLVTDNHEIIKEHVSRLRELKVEQKSASQVIGFLAQEVLGFRQRIAQLFDPESAANYKAQTPPQLEFTLPDLGTLTDIASVNEDLMSDLAKGLDQLRTKSDAQRRRLQDAEQELRAEKSEREIIVERAKQELKDERAERESTFAAQTTSFEERNAVANEEIGNLRGGLARQMMLVELLAELVDEMRRGITAVFTQEMRFEPSSLSINEEIIEHVPGLGDIETIQRVNHDLLSELHGEIRALRLLQSEVVLDEEKREAPVPEISDRDESSTEEPKPE